MKKAFEYYTISSESSKFTLCHWSKYNLAKYFYENGCLEIGIEQDLNKSIELLDDVSEELIEASIELLYIYYDLYLKSGKNESKHLEKINFYKEKCEKNINYNDEIRMGIENKLKQIHNEVKPIEIP